MKTQWTGRVVTDTRGDESTAYEDLKDWLLDYYEIDDDEAECLSEHLTAAEYLYAAAYDEN